jgi:hypothetical protein
MADLSLNPPIPGSHRHRMTHRQDQLPSLRGVTLRMLGQLPLARSPIPDAQPVIGGSRLKERANG